MSSLPPEIEHINEALASFERELPNPSEKAIHSFANALIELWLYVHYNPDNRHLEGVKRFRIAYVRRFFENYNALPALKEEDWFNIRMGLSIMKDDIEALLGENPELRSEYKSFKDLYPEREYEMRKDRLIKELQKHN